ncbi:MAG: TauD/TfdA family dioxygenase [Pseudomonadota bacterium]
MPANGPSFRPLEGASFGVLAEIAGPSPVETFIAAGAEIRDRLNEAGGLMVVRGLGGLDKSPEALVRLSRVFGPEVENYRETLTGARFFHEAVPEILVLSNRPPCNHPPPPQAETESGGLPVRFPEQPNWHTDQSYRRPPPDITLLYAVKLPPPHQGQTLFANCSAAYEALDGAKKARIAGLKGIHAPSWIGRTAEDVRNGATPKPLLDHQRPQRQPLVRIHPETGRPALYLCEDKQMDFVEGPIAGLAPGPDGEGAQLLHVLMRHATGPAFTYVHEWAPGDLVIGDNRCLLHAATWYDAERYTRLMLRTTVMGNPGADYAGEAKSWIPRDGSAPMQGMENA